MTLSFIKSINYSIQQNHYIYDIKKWNPCSRGALTWTPEIFHYYCITFVLKMEELFLLFLKFFY
jgi:hypothetical protein